MGRPPSPLEEASAQFHSARFDDPLIWMEWNLQKSASGLRDADVPIMMAIAKVEEVDKLIGLSVRADDYVVKPFCPRKVVACRSLICLKISAWKRSPSSDSKEM
jgi:DNA-binding response OmpR family regulator